MSLGLILTSSQSHFKTNHHIIMNAKITLTEEQGANLFRSLFGTNSIKPANKWLNDNLASILTIEPLVVTEEVYERFSRIWSNYGLNPALRAFADTHFKLASNKDQSPTFIGLDGKTWTRHDGGEPELDKEPRVYKAAIAILEQSLEAANQKVRELEQALASANSCREDLQVRIAEAGRKIDQLEENISTLGSTYNSERRKLEDEITSIRPRADCYDRILSTLGIEKDVLGYIKNLKSIAQLRPIAEMPETVPEGCVRYYWDADFGFETLASPDTDTHFIDILLPAPEDTSMREFEEWAKSEWGDMPEYNSVGWRAWKAARNTKA